MTEGRGAPHSQHLAAASRNPVSAVAMAGQQYHRIGLAINAGGVNPETTLNGAVQ